MSAINARALINANSATVQGLSDTQLAEAYTASILLHHQARMEGQRYARNRDPELPFPEDAEALCIRLRDEITRRGKRWALGLTGESWLEPAKAEAPQP